MSPFLRNFVRVANRMLHDESTMLRWGLMLAFIASIPIFAKSVIPTAFKLPPFQVIMYNTYVTDVPYRSMALMLGTICIPMIIDTIFDIIEMVRGLDIMKSVLLKSVQENTTTHVKITRLNAHERLLYLVGVSLQVLVLFTFDHNDDQRVIVYNFVRVNCSFYVGKLMAYIAVMCFLQRCTTTWTPLRTVIAVTFMAVGVICKNLRYTVGDPDIRATVSTAGSSLMSISFALQIIFILMCFVGYMKHEWLVSKTPIDDTDDLQKDEIHDRLLAIDKFYANYVPAAHMLVLFFDICCDYDFIYDTVDAYQYWDVTINLAVLFVLTILVIVMEGRIKHNEVVRVMLRSLLATKNSYEQLLKVKKEHVRFISHEIRSPLSAAISGIQVLENDYKRNSLPADGDRVEILSDIHLSCVAALDILNDLLTFEKMESGLMDLRKETVSPIAVVRDSIQIFVMQAKSKNITLELLTSGMLHKDDDERVLGLSDADVLSCDRFKVAQVVRNFVSNAIKFTPSGGKVTIHACFKVNGSSLKNVDKKEKQKQRSSFFASIGKVVSSAVDDHKEVDPPDDDTDILYGNLRISVTDTGAGISEEDQGKLFKTVVQFRPEILQAGGGSGFGMFISAGIVSAHGGLISVRSDGEGHGATFSFTIPMTRSVDRRTGITKDRLIDDNNNATDAARRASRHGSITTGQSQSRHGSITGQSRGQPVSHPNSTPNAAKVNDVMDRVDEDKEMIMVVKPNPHPHHGDRDRDTQLPVQSCVDIVPFVTSERVNDPSATLLYHVLVVDDSLMNRKMLASLLKSVGHTCDQAVDGLKAIEAVRAKLDAGLRYDAILMDFVMPNMEGPTATAEIRAMGVDWPIFGLTGNGMESDIQTFLKAGANDVFVKPMYIEHFEFTMRSLSKPSEVFVAV